MQVMHVTRLYESGYLHRQVDKLASSPVCALCTPVTQPQDEGQADLCGLSTF